MQLRAGCNRWKYAVCGAQTQELWPRLRILVQSDESGVEKLCTPSTARIFTSDGRQRTQPYPAQPQKSILKMEVGWMQTHAAIFPASPCACASASVTRLYTTHNSPAHAWVAREDDTTRQRFGNTLVTSLIIPWGEIAFFVSCSWDNPPLRQTPHRCLSVDSQLRVRFLSATKILLRYTSTSRLDSLSEMDGECVSSDVCESLRERSTFIDDGRDKCGAEP